MTPDTAQGVSAELAFVLQDGWSYSKESDRFLVWPSTGLLTRENFKHLLRDEVWRIARFVAYRRLVSISGEADGSYEVLSRSESGSGFQIVFKAVGRE